MIAWTAWVALSVVGAEGSVSHWNLGPGCPSTQEAEGRYAAVATSSSGVDLDAHVVGTEGGYAAVLDLSGAVTAHRELSDPDCDALVDAIILLVGMARR